MELKNRRVEMGFTQDQLARILHTDRSTVAKWEAGGSLPRADKLPILAKILNCTVDELLRTEPENGVSA